MGNIKKAIPQSPDVPHHWFPFLLLFLYQIKLLPFALHVDLETLIHERLNEMQGDIPRNHALWPAGCYGSARSVLMFVGPSPGGRASEQLPNNVRKENAGMALWNQDFLEPFDSWSNGFRTSLQPIVETLLGLPLEAGAAKLFGFANFDWKQAPDVNEVKHVDMLKGVQDVLHVLEFVRPPIIVTLERKSHNLLLDTLTSVKYDIDQAHINGRVQINANSWHRNFYAYHIGGAGPLAGSFLIKLPQHPARIYKKAYAERCAKVLRLCYENLVSGHTPLTFELAAAE